MITREVKEVDEKCNDILDKLLTVSHTLHVSEVHSRHSWRMALPRSCQSS